MTSTNSPLTPDQPSASGLSGSSMKALVASVDHRRLRGLQEVARGLGYIPVATKAGNILTTLLASEEIELVLLDMRHSGNRCALGHLLRQCFPRISLMLISATVTDWVVCNECPARCQPHEPIRTSTLQHRQSPTGARAATAEGNASLPLGTKSLNR